MSSIPARAWLLILLSAALQVLIFPIAGPVSTMRAATAWIALVPFLLALLQPARNDQPLRIAHATLLGYACGILWYIGNCYWIYQTMYLYGGLPKPVALGILILFALYLGLYHALFANLLLLVRRSRFGTPAALVLAPFLWVAIELARARITGFPWDLLGNTQIDNLLLTRIAPIAGVMSISFVLVAINSALSAHFLLRSRARTFIGCIGIFIALTLQLGDARLLAPAAEATSSLAVMLQENLEVGALGREASPVSPRAELPLFADITRNPGWTPAHTSTGDRLLTLLPGMHPTVIIWPEAPSHLRSDNSDFRSAIGKLARSEQTPAIIGSLGVDFSNNSPSGYFLYDSASLFDSAGSYHGRYDKIHLVPWGEYVPFKQFFAFASKLTEGVGDMDRGTDRTIFTSNGHNYGIFVCYESIFGDEVRQFTKNGAQVLVNISDDGWYGDTGAPWQHLNMTRMRAVENHRWLLLDTNTGITTAIDPEGRTPVEAPRHIRAAFALPFAFLEGTTFYTRHGDWFAWLCVIVSLSAITYSLKGAVLRAKRPARAAGVHTPF